MRVDVERRRGPGVGETSRHDRDRYASVEHLGGHEVSKIMQSKMRKTSSPTSSDEMFGHEVRQPWSGPHSVGTEHKALFDRIFCVLFRHTLKVGPQEFDPAGIERDTVRTTGLVGTRTGP